MEDFDPLYNTHFTHEVFKGGTKCAKNLREVCHYSQNVISEHFVFYIKQLVCVASGGIDRVILL